MLWGFICLFLGVLFLLLQLRLWIGLVMGRGARLTIPSRLGMAIENIVIVFSHDLIWRKILFAHFFNNSKKTLLLVFLSIWRKILLQS